MSLTRLTLALLTACTFAQAQQIAKYEPDAKITYDRFSNQTWYESEAVKLTPWKDDERYKNWSPPIDLSAQFGCYGDTGEAPCTPPQVLLVFKYFDFRSGGSSLYGQLPFDRRSRDVIAIADGKRTPLGSLNVEYRYEPSASIVTGTLPVDIEVLRRLVSATEVEMKVGTVPVSLTGSDIETLGSFYNMVVLTAKQSTPTRRGTRRGRKP